MSLTELLFSIKGRINRKPWWLASLAVGVATSLITAILEFAARLSGNRAVDRGTQVVEPTGILRLVVLAVGLANT